MNLPAVNLKAINTECGAALLAAYHRVLNADRLILGTEVQAFERSWADYCGAKYCVGVGNGYDALRLMLLAFDIGPGDVVAVAGNTHISAWLAIRSVGANVFPVDPDEHSHCLTAESIEATPNYEQVTAILATHLYGRAADGSGLQALADSLEAPLFFDACQAHGLRDLPGDASAFSFYPTKNLGALGDAGAVVTSSAEAHAKMRALRNYGGAEQNKHQYAKGINSRMDELQAAFLNAKLSWLEEWNNLREANARRYLEGLRGYTEVKLPRRGSAHVWHQFVVRHAQRDLFRSRLQARGVGTLVHYPTPPHLQPAFQPNYYRLPISELLAKEVVSLPVGPEVRAEQVEHAVEAIRWCA